MLHSLTTTRRNRRSIRHTGLWLSVGFSIAVLSMAGCSALDVSSPSVIADKDLDNTDGANRLFNNARFTFADAVSAMTYHGGMLTDELFRDLPLSSLITSVSVDDIRASDLMEKYASNDYFGAVQTARTDVDVALPRVRAYGVASAREAQVAELFALRGYLTLHMAEDFCPGFPLHSIVNAKPDYGSPLTTDEAFTIALADFDSALVHVGDSASIRAFAQLGKARTLLDLGQFADAGALAASVPLGFARQAVAIEYKLPNKLLGSHSVADHEGHNGLDFVSANDPRVRVTPVRHVRNGDITQWRYAADKYSDPSSPVIVASDIEARLIEAEAALNVSSGTWLSILNTLRTDGTFSTQPNAADPTVTDTVWHAGTGGIDGLRPLDAPTTTAAQVDLLFRERAFWLFLTGHRLGDVRRLIRHYQRAPETVFPTGTYRVGGTYGTAISLPFDGATEHAFNPAVTGCTER